MTGRSVLDSRLRGNDEFRNTPHFNPSFPRKRESSNTIDVVVIAPEFDENRNMETVEKLWLATADADNRIEPIACGMREWESDSPRPILAIARREGIEITA